MKNFLTILIILMSAMPVFAAKGTIATYVIDPEKMRLSIITLGLCMWRKNAIMLQFKSLK